MKKTPLAAFAGAIEWIVVALVFALIFRGFVVEAFKIPTGSMAPTLRGDHFHLTCHQCGKQFDVGFQAGRNRNPNIAKFTKCPVCGYLQRVGAPKTGGDRILVLKSIYQFREPERWDVFVFKNPTEPNINYIKRLVGLPGETIHIYDGDLFIDGEIARKPEKILEEMWMPVYSNDYLPSRPQEPRFSKDGDTWERPFTEEGGSWGYSQEGREISCSSKGISQLKYDSQTGNGFGAYYAYNASPAYPGEICSDLKMEYQVLLNDDTVKIGASINKYGRVYRGLADFEKNKMFLIKSYNGKEQVLASKDIPELKAKKSLPLSFNNADYRLSFSLGECSLEYVLGSKIGDIGKPGDSRKPQISLLCSGQAEFRHISIWRDMHYITYGVKRGDEPFELGEDEFFACGDNSPSSADSRLWDIEGIGNNGDKFPVGVVPREYVSGRAFMVYWPGSLKFKPDGKMPIPNVGQMRLIYGG
ncbi:Signal peptidase I [Sedimentisphaera cyanobacteriorum]|uniref:Signal peptidase I n=1 Tax=Sedimentisphaera cyanobacteriorum TaxID=1940790 RepID=A0A1Q2HP50_9BACT|nr:signal peptidase I [Sedimentisphaera cyanobacteriorum]AQQ09036.1 Signal peptidase I [Sedimentisphaera cyanobacteriorum]